MFDKVRVSLAWLEGARDQQLGLAECVDRQLPPMFLHPLNFASVF